MAGMDGEFENRDPQSSRLEIPPYEGRPIALSSAPQTSTNVTNAGTGGVLSGGNVSGMNIPAYTSKVGAVYDSRLINSYDVNESGYARNGTSIGNCTYTLIGNIATCVFTYPIPAGYVFVLREYRVTFGNVLGGFTNLQTSVLPLPTLNILVDNNSIKQHLLPSFINDRLYKCFYIIPQNTVLSLRSMSDLVNINVISSIFEIYGNLILSQQLPPNLEIAGAI